MVSELCSEIKGLSPSMSYVTAEKMKFSIRDFFTFSEEILNGKLHFLCSMCRGELSTVITRLMPECL